MSIEWTKESIGKLDPAFLAKVVARMHWDGTVRFGTTGDGIRPNYQICLADKEPVAYNGANHEQFPATERFDEAKLSEEFRFDELPATRLDRIDAKNAVVEFAKGLDAKQRDFASKHREELIELSREVRPEAAFQRIVEKYGN